MKNHYKSKQAKILRVEKESKDVNTIHIKTELKFQPGQYIMIGKLGVGECPISISSSPEDKNMELTVRKVGKITSFLHSLKRDDRIEIRGPYGNSFPVQIQKNVFFIAGGIGLAPLRSMIRSILEKREKYRRICLFYGAREKKEFLYQKELKDWKKSMEVYIIAEKGRGRTGVVTHLMNEVEFNGQESLAYICGPPVMFKFVYLVLREKKFKEESIFLTLERHMKCGIGKCGHCRIHDKYICTDGPVFSWKEYQELSK